MRKILMILCISAIMIAIPTVSFGAEYTVNDDNLTVSIDDSQWKVFTRENIKNNKELKKLGTDYETMKNSMNNVDAYLVAVKEGKKTNTELMVRATEMKYINNMNTLDKEELKALKKGVQETSSEEIDNCKTEIYKSDNCKYIKITGDYDKGEYYTVEYFTIINGINYLFTVQKKGKISSEENTEMLEIVDSAEYNVNPELTENDIEKYIAQQEKINAENQPQEASPLTKAIGVLVVAVGVVLILRFKNRKRRRI